MGRECISKLYIGHLPVETTEEELKTFLLAGGKGQLARNSFGVTVKKGYAFMQCCNQATADLVIDRFHGASFNGNTICVEPAVSTFSGASAKHGRCLITLVPCEESNNSEVVATLEDLHKILGVWGGSVLSLEKQSSESYVITVADLVTATDLVAGCNGMMMNGLKVKAETAPDFMQGGGATRGKPIGLMDVSTSSTELPGGHRPRFSGPRPFGRGRGFGPNSRSRGNGTSRSSNGQFPWRMLVPAAQVGALIGRNGSTIRGITQSSGARVNIHTGHGPRNYDAEKIVSIVGSPEGITSACRQILEVLAKDLSKTFGAELTLRIIAFNSLIGRVIGKGGSNITKVMQDSQTKIHISNLHEMPRSLLKHSDCDRIITIRGSIAGMSQAESLISAKLRSSFEADLQASTMKDGFPIGYFHYP